MSDHVSFADLLTQAEKEGISFENVPIGNYEMYVKSAKAGRTSNGKLRLEVTGAIIGGPMDGKTVWNQFVVSPENGKALGFFFRHMTILGAGIEWFKPRALNDSTMAELATVVLGARFNVDVGIAAVSGADRNQFDKVAPSKVAPGQKYTGTGSTPAPAGAMVPGAAPPIPSVATSLPQVAVPQPPPQETAAAPQPVLADGTTAEINGQTFVMSGGNWVPATQTAAPEPQASTAPPAAPKAPF